MTASNRVLEIHRSSHSRTRLADVDPPPLAPGAVRLRLGGVALTANAITDALVGDMMGYWSFYPADHPWGRVPALGWGDVVESNHPGIAVGARYAGYVTFAGTVDVLATPTPGGFLCDDPGRAHLQTGYRMFDEITGLTDDEADRLVVVFYMLATGYLTDLFVADLPDDRPQQLLLTSASSKTAIGIATYASRRDGIQVVGLTSPDNVGFVEALDIYDEVVAYPDAAGVRDVPSILLDMSGNLPAVAAIHGRLASNLLRSFIVGFTHHISPPADVVGGPARELLLTPDEYDRRLQEWGYEGMFQRVQDDIFPVLEQSSSWIKIERCVGEAAVADAWCRLFDGDVAPDTGLVVDLSGRT